MDKPKPGTVLLQGSNYHSIVDCPHCGEPIMIMSALSLMAAPAVKEH